MVAKICQVIFRKSPKTSYKKSKIIIIQICKIFKKTRIDKDINFLYNNDIV